MISRALLSRRNPFAHWIKIRRNQTSRNLSVYGRNTTSPSRVIKTNNLGRLKTFLSRLKSPSMSSSCNDGISIVYYAEVKDLCNHPEKLLIDVREPSEFRLGRIPHSINIPLGELCKELGIDVDNEMFHEKYGRPKPNPDTCIILYCRTGNRSAAAAQVAVDIGYENVCNYSGSWLDYVRNSCGE